jgi:hypothetical protein
LSNYKDINKKLEYYKQQILKDLVSQGIYPNNSLIESKLKNIDTYLAIFQNYNVATGELFNANEYNERLKLIYQDLLFLYELLYELTILEYNKLQNFVNSHLSELNSIVETYNKRAEYENGTTTLGKTLLFKNNSFSIEHKDSVSIINLGSINVENGSTIACISNINNIEADNVIFKFKKEGDLDWITTSAYNYNNDLLVIPGELKKNLFEHKLQDEQKINGPLLLDVISDINIRNKYDILGGKNKIFVNYKDDDGFIVEEKPLVADSLYFDRKAYINFYVINGNSISFRFNKKPVSTNFPIDTQRIDNLKYIQHFFIECDEGFTFEFELDKGTVYAIKETGIISDDKLYYTGSEQVNDFLIIETTTGDKKSYNVVLEAYNSNEDLDIDSIIIKQLD